MTQFAILDDANFFTHPGRRLCDGKAAATAADNDKVVSLLKHCLLLEIRLRAALMSAARIFLEKLNLGRDCFCQVAFQVF